MDTQHIDIKEAIAIAQANGGAGVVSLDGIRPDAYIVTPAKMAELTRRPAHMRPPAPSVQTLTRKRRKQIAAARKLKAERQDRIRRSAITAQNRRNEQRNKLKRKASGHPRVIISRDVPPGYLFGK